MEREDIIEMSQFFRASKILMAANEFDLFTILSERPMTAPVLSAELNAETRKIELLLNALVALNLLEKQGGAYQNSQAAEDFLVARKEGYLGHFLKHVNSGLDTWNQLENSVFGRKPEINWSENFTLAMEDNAYKRAVELAESVDLSGKKKLLDVGGGSGAHSVAFVNAYPELEATVFDLPGPIKIAKKLLDEKGVGDRVKTMEGDFEVEKFGSDFDCALLSNIIHFQDGGANIKLLKKVYSALQIGGIVIIHDLILDEEKTSPKDAAIFALHMLLSSGDGRTYTWSEIETWLKEAGFVESRRNELKKYRTVVAEKQ